MRATDAYSELVSIGRPVIETREAAARLRVSGNVASKALRALEQAGLVGQIHKGLWALDLDAPAAVVAPYLTAPYPAYLSMWTVLAQNGMIEQIPARIDVASLDRSRTVNTRRAPAFLIHRLAPEVFTGFEGSPESGYLALPEKALWDIAYVRAPRGGIVRFPELVLPQAFDRSLLDEWTAQVPRARLRTLVARGVEAALSQADRLAAADR